MNKNLHRLFITLIFIAITSAAYLLSNQKNNNTSPPPPISTTSSHLSTTATIILAELKNNPNADPQNTSKKTGPKILTPSTSIPTAPPTSSPPLENQTNTVPVTFIINNQEFALKLKPGSTAYDAMIQLQESKQISFVSKKFSGLGYFIEEININAIMK